MPAAVEAPRAAMFHNLEARLVVAIQQLIGDPAGRPFVGEFQSGGAKPLYADYRNNLIR